MFILSEEGYELGRSAIRSFDLTIISQRNFATAHDDQKLIKLLLGSNFKSVAYSTFGQIVAAILTQVTTV